MSEKLLADWSEADGIPRSIALTVASYAALMAATAFPGKAAFDVSDQAKLVELADCRQVWRMTAFSPPAWDLDDAGPDDHTADFQVIGVLASLTGLASNAFDVGNGTLAAGKRVLSVVPGGYQGLFILSANGSNWDLTRAPDLSADGQVINGAAVTVRFGQFSGNLYVQLGTSLSTLSYAAPSNLSTSAAPTLTGPSSTLFDFSQSQTVEIIPLAGNNPVAGTWETLTGLTASNGQPDADGIPRATAFTETGTGVRVANHTPGNVPQAGWVRAKFSYLPGPAFDPKHLIFMISGYHWLLLPTLQSLKYPGSDANYTVYGLNGTVLYYYGFKFTPRGKWIDCEYETNIAAAHVDVAQFCSFTTRGVSAAARAGVIISASNVQLQQDRVVSVTPVRGSTDSLLAQSTDTARPVLAPDIWFGHPALVEGYGNNCALTKDIAACTLATVGVVIWVGCIHPSTTSRQIYSLNGTVSRLAPEVDPTGFWRISRTDDAGVTTSHLTTHPVAPVPVHVEIEQGPTSATLYIDGLPASGGVLATSTVATFTSHTLFGGDSQSVVETLSEAFGMALTAAQVASQCAEMRAMAYLPAKWPALLNSGQSNAVTVKGTTKALVGNGIFAHPGYALYAGDNGGYATTTGWDTDPITGPTGGVGIRLGWQAEAQKNNQPAIAINIAHGGAAITAWEPGGADYDYIATTLATALASFGTHLISVEDIFWTQGEYESNDPGTVAGYYAGKLTALIAYLRSLPGVNPNASFGIHRVNEWLGPGTLVPVVSYMSSALVRADEDLVAATVPNCYKTDLSGGAQTNWCVHYSPAQCIEIGRIAWRTRHRQPARIQIIEADRPQRGTWGATGGCFDFEHNVVLSGTNVVSVASTEGTAILTSAGSPVLTTDPLGGKKRVTVAAGRYLQSLDSVRWGVYSGASSFLMGMLWWIGSGGEENYAVLSSLDISNSAFLIKSNTIYRQAYRNGGGSALVFDAPAVAAPGTQQWAVYGGDGTNLFAIDSAGIRIAVDTTGARVGVDRLMVNQAHYNTQSWGNFSLRRLYIKQSTPALVFSDGIDLATAFSALF